MAKKQSTKKRSNIDWKTFFSLVQHGHNNAHIANKLGIHIDKKSADPYKPIRAMKSRAKTVGVTINGETVKLKMSKAAKQKPKPKAKQPHDSIAAA